MISYIENYTFYAYEIVRCKKYIMHISLMFVYIGLKIPFQVNTGQILLTASVKKKRQKKEK